MTNETVMTTKSASAESVTVARQPKPSAPPPPNASVDNAPETANVDSITERDMQRDVAEAMAAGGVWFAAFVTGQAGVRIVTESNPEGWPIPPGYDLVLLGTGGLPGDPGFNLIRVTDQGVAGA